MVAPFVVDVAVVGGGLGGLALAVGEYHGRKASMLPLELDANRQLRGACSPHDTRRPLKNMHACGNCSPSSPALPHSGNLPPACPRGPLLPYCL